MPLQLDLGQIDFGGVGLPPDIPVFAALSAAIVLAGAQAVGVLALAGDTAEQVFGLPRFRQWSVGEDADEGRDCGLVTALDQGMSGLEAHAGLSVRQQLGDRLPVVGACLA